MEPDTQRNQEIERVAMDRELGLLIQLLDDPDPEIASIIEERIVSRGPSAMESLLDFADLTSDDHAQQRARDIASRLNVELLAADFERLKVRLQQGKRFTLEDGAFLIARYGNPRLNVENCRFELSAFAGMLRERIAGVHSPFDILTLTNHFFFEELKFRGNQNTFLDPENSYISSVLDRRVGIPISLAVIVLLVARTRLNLPFSGVATPAHFMLRFDGTDDPIFIDAFNGGLLFKANDIERFLKAGGLSFTPKFLEPATTTTILLRMMRNLIMVFAKSNEPKARIAFERFTHILSPELIDGDVFMGGLDI